jgi:hypothetical protein
VVTPLTDYKKEKADGEEKEEEDFHSGSSM